MEKNSIKKLKNIEKLNLINHKFVRVISIIEIKIKKKEEKVLNILVFIFILCLLI